jgi:hypothetical protein
MPRSPSSSSGSNVRPYYVFTAVVFAIGMALAAVAESWSSFFVFSVLCLMFVWVAARSDRGLPGPGEPEGGSARLRPSERRRQRKQQG